MTNKQLISEFKVYASKPSMPYLDPLMTDTVKQKVRSVEMFSDFLGGKNLADASEKDIRDFYEDLNGGRSGENWSWRRVVHLNEFFQFACDKGKLSKNLCLKFKKPRIGDPVRDLLPEEDLLEVIFSLDLCGPKGQRNVAAILTLASNGLRLSEFENLRLCDIDTENKTIRVKDPRGNIHILPMHPGSAQMCEKYRQDGRKYHAKKSEPETGASEADAFFLSTSGKPMTKNALSKFLRNHSKKVLGYPISATDIRLALARGFRVRGVDENYVKYLLRVISDRTIEGYDRLYSLPENEKTESYLSDDIFDKLDFT